MIISDASDANCLNGPYNNMKRHCKELRFLSFYFLTVPLIWPCTNGILSSTFCAHRKQAWQRSIHLSSSACETQTHRASTMKARQEEGPARTQGPLLPGFLPARSAALVWRQSIKADTDFPSQLSPFRTRPDDGAKQAQWVDRAAQPGGHMHRDRAQVPHSHLQGKASDQRRSAVSLTLCLPLPTQPVSQQM